MEFFIQQLANGIALGSVYALVAVGFTMVYGVLFFVNLPHGDILMAGAYVLFVLIASGLPYVPAVAMAVVFTAMLAVLVELVAYRRLRNARRLAPLLSAIGVSYLLSNAILLVMGPRPRPFPQPFSGQINIAGIEVPLSIIATMVITITAVVALEYFVHRTRLGSAIKAASQDRVAVSLMGANVNWIIAVTFAISGGLALLGGMMLGWRYGTISPLIGFAVMLRAFVACVIGGIGNIAGAMIGGLILGISEVMVVSFMSSAYRDAITFAILIGVLLVRPHGILKGRTDAGV